MALSLNILKVTTFDLAVEKISIILKRLIGRYTKIFVVAFIIILEMVYYS